MQREGVVSAEINGYEAIGPSETPERTGEQTMQELRGIFDSESKTMPLASKLWQLHGKSQGDPEGYRRMGELIN